VPAAAFTGLHGTLRAHEHAGGHAVLLATFTPAGAAAFLRPSQESFSGTTTDLTGLLGRPEELDRLHERLAASPNHGRRIALLEDFLLGRLRLAAPDPLVTAAVSWLFRSGAFHQRVPTGRGLHARGIFSAGDGERVNPADEAAADGIARQAKLVRGECAPK
jgi:hypothetical protein